MTRFDLEDRYLALRMMELLAQPLLKQARALLNTNNAYRFGLKCKTRGLIAHDRVLTGRIV